MDDPWVEVRRDVALAPVHVPQEDSPRVVAGLVGARRRGFQSGVQAPPVMILIGR